MTSRLNGSGVFAQAVSSLTNAYAYTLSSMEDTSKKGVEIKDILNVFNNSSSETNKQTLMNNLLTGNSLSLNNAFSSYLTSSFSGIDTNHDGMITSEEMNKYTSLMYTNGMSLEQLTLLSSQYGNSNSTLQTLIDNFYDIDKNHDGRITQTEISTYGVDKEIDDKKTKYKEFRPKSMSVYVKFKDSNTDS